MFNAPSRFIYEIPRYLIKESSSEGYISAPSSASADIQMLFHLYLTDSLTKPPRPATQKREATYSLIIHT